MKLYLDACIWIDFFDPARESHTKAKELFEWAETNKCLIIVSKVHLREMRATGNFYNFVRAKDDLFRKGMCCGVSYSEEDFQIAMRHNERFQMGHSDCLHLVIARKEKAKPISSDLHWKEIGSAFGTRVYDYEDYMEAKA
ncbi:MAG: hypothetical protein V1911_00780 [Candidatus Micrarchaeota archaeon]